MSLQSGSFVSNDLVAAGPNQLLLESGPLTAELLNATVPLVMRVFSLGDFVASTSVVESLNKFINLLKQQHSRIDIVQKIYETQSPGKYFLAAKFLPEMLDAIFRQMQYSPDFMFDGDADEEIAEMEVR